MHEEHEDIVGTARTGDVTATSALSKIVLHIEVSYIRDLMVQSLYIYPNACICCKEMQQSITSDR